MALNSIQKEILDALLKLTFDECKGLNNPENALNVLKGIVCTTDVLPEIQSHLEALNLWDIAKEMRDILEHPHPQNRRVGNPGAASGNADGIINNEVYYWANGFGHELRHEPCGLLGLSARNDAQTLAACKNDVVQYIKHACYRELFKYQKELKLSSWGLVEYSRKIQGEVQAKQHIFLHFNNKTITIDSKLAHDKQKDLGLYPDLNNISHINCSEGSNSNEEIEKIRQHIAAERPTYTKRARSDNGFVSHSFDFKADRQMWDGFYGKDPAMGLYLAFVNKYVFAGNIPLILLNILRVTCGQELIDYQADINYESQTLNTLPVENASLSYASSSSASEVQPTLTTQFNAARGVLPVVVPHSNVGQNDPMQERPRPQ